MKRSASEIINNLETRIAQLERNAKIPIDGSEIELMENIDQYLLTALNQLLQVQITVEKTDLNLNREVKGELRNLIVLRKQIQGSHLRLNSLRKDLED